VGATRYSVRLLFGSTLIRFDSYSVRLLFSSILIQFVLIQFDPYSVRPLFGSIAVRFPAHLSSGLPSDVRKRLPFRRPPIKSS